MATIHNNAQSCDYFTFGRPLELAHRFLGKIGLDPCSCLLANEQVLADRYYTKREDGLQQRWIADTLFCNPPGGHSRLTQKFWAKLLESYNARDVKSAAFLSFALNTFQTTQNKGSRLGVLEFPTFIWSTRCDYLKVVNGAIVLKEDGTPDTCTVAPSAISFLLPGWRAASPQERELWFEHAASITDELGHEGVWLCY